MNRHEQIDQLWRELREAINKTYKQAKSEDNASALRDYAEDISWHDDLAALLGRESANERQHRSSRTVRGFSIQDAAKLILMNNVVSGSKMTNAPSGIQLLAIRHTAFEAEVIGWLVRHNVTEEWCAAVESLDYSKIMQAASA